MGERGRLARYLSGAAVARVGDELSGPALLLTGLAWTGSAASGSALLAGLTASAAVGGPLFGALLDRSARPGRLLAVALALYGCGLVVVLLSLSRVPLPCVVAVAVVAGLLGPALTGGWTSQLPRVAGRWLSRANAWDAMTFQLATLVGPGLAGLVAGVAGASAGVVVAVVLLGVAVPLAWSLPSAVPSVGVGDGGGVGVPLPLRAPHRPSLRRELGEGFRAIGRSRPLWRATVMTAVSHVGLGVLVSVVPLLGLAVWGRADRGPFLLVAASVGALAVGAALSRWPGVWGPEALLCRGTALMGLACGLAAMGWVPGLWCAGVLLGVGEGAQLTALFAVRHREAPERLRGQIFTTGASVKVSGFALGVAVGGPLGGWSPWGALWCAAGAQGVALLCGPSVRALSGDRSGADSRVGWGS
ncbi:MFS transporter [Streptomyces sp. NPDC005438]|uniref:MFS transporter n=1 Tax=Streptomyces sp. NPDC005438 TaxID=3156880 RepID=UPI0033B8D804